MPCDSVIRLSLDLKAMNRALLKRGLERDGWQVSEGRGIMYARKEYRTIEFHKDRAVVNDGDQDLLNKAYTSYNKELVRAGAAKFGMTISATSQANKWQVTKPVFGTLKSSF